MPETSDPPPQNHCADQDPPALGELGIVLIAHGSRVAKANQELHLVADGLRQRGFPLVVPGYLELAQPDILAAGAECVAAGANQVILVPYFLSAGRHAAQDLEAARLALGERFPWATFSLAAPLGPHPLLEAILVERVRAVLSQTLT